MLYNGPFDQNFVMSLKPSAAMLATLPESMAEDFAKCVDEPTGCSRAWMRACLHFLPDDAHPVLSTFRHTVGAKAGMPDPEPVEVELGLADQLKKMTVVALKEKLVERELKVSGKKSELVERLLADMQEKGAGAVAAAEPSATQQSVAAAEAPQQTAAEAPQESAAPPPAAADAPSDPEAFQKMTVKDLKALLKDNSLKVSGKKQELVERCIANGLSVPVAV